ncbi:tryptophan-rich sensory protein [Terrimonas sp. NA20]|uniref:Tryptophan-rich sensory protein n=1 Tax=Terrimonas ginsenosidimutans TaxID=2908004 RepID=A0ABS9KVE1_9BACT|nr:TspO/MBR family protein [Terrimonas ginsenosidimutans]MCG2616255.1 tryptophan-rich sensory protein [Terrimonas ginsenosidimutans]
MKKWQLLTLSLALPLAVGVIAGLVTAQNVQEWYPTIRKPGFTPPNFLFGPVWAVLYITMGISLYLILKQPASRYRQNAVISFGIQLFLNFWWGFAFFQFHLIALAAIIIIALWICILVMIRQFYKVSPLASNLQWPYLAWVSFASALNISIWYLN